MERLVLEIPFYFIFCYTHLKFNHRNKNSHLSKKIIIDRKIFITHLESEEHISLVSEKIFFGFWQQVSIHCSIFFNFNSFEIRYFAEYFIRLPQNLYYGVICQNFTDTTFPYRCNVFACCVIIENHRGDIPIKNILLLYFIEKFNY